MKKYTNKILIVAAALFLATLTVLVFYEVSNIKEQINKTTRQLSAINY